MATAVPEILRNVCEKKGKREDGGSNTQSERFFFSTRGKDQIRTQRPNNKTEAELEDVRNTLTCLFPQRNCGLLSGVPQEALRVFATSGELIIHGNDPQERTRV